MDLLPLLVVTSLLLVTKKSRAEEAKDGLFMKLLLNVGLELGALKNKVDHLQGELDQVRNKARVGGIPRVAFSVTRTSILPAQSHRTNVAWQHVITNVGGAWDQSLSQFRAPISGLYAFHLTAPGHGGKSWINLHLKKNGYDVITAHGTGRSGAEGSTHVVLDLNKSDTVSVQMAGRSLYADINQRPVFAGFLIAPAVSATN